MKRLPTMKVTVAVTVWYVVVACLVSECSVVMRREECLGNKCVSSARNPWIVNSNLRMSVLGVEMPQTQEQNVSYSSNQFTPLPYAAFMQPRPVYQRSEERVFNVLDKERTIERLLKGGKRQIDRIKGDSKLSESNSRSNVQFRRRKGGKRSDRRKQLRRERIKKKRTRRKNRRKNKREKKKKKKNNKSREGKRKKLKRGKLKSLSSRGRRRNREEQIGLNPTSFIEDPDPSDNKQQTDFNTSPGGSIPLEVISTQILTEGRTNKQDDSRIGIKQHINVQNYHGTDMDLDDYKDEQDEADMEYLLQDSNDYEISPDYFNWNDNSSFDYFTQREDTTVIPGEYYPSHCR